MAKAKPRQYEAADLAVLEELMAAGMEGVRRSPWRLGDPVEGLVASIVLRVVICASRQLRLGEPAEPPMWREVIDA